MEVKSVLTISCPGDGTRLWSFGQSGTSVEMLISWSGRGMKMEQRVVYPSVCSSGSPWSWSKCCTRWNMGLIKLKIHRVWVQRVQEITQSNGRQRQTKRKRNQTHRQWKPAWGWGGSVWSVTQCAIWTSAKSWNADTQAIALDPGWTPVLNINQCWEDKLKPCLNKSVFPCQFSWLGPHESEAVGSEVILCRAAPCTGLHAVRPPCSSLTTSPPPRPESHFVGHCASAGVEKLLCREVRTSGQQ